MRLISIIPILLISCKSEVYNDFEISITNAKEATIIIEELPVGPGSIVRDYDSSQEQEIHLRNIAEGQYKVSAFAKNQVLDTTVTHKYYTKIHFTFK